MSLLVECVPQVDCPQCSSPCATIDGISYMMRPTEHFVLTDQEYQSVKALIASEKTGIPQGFDTAQAATIFAGGFGLIVSAFLLAFMVGAVLRVIKSA